MIASYADKDTEKLAHYQRVARFAQIERVALRKLIQLEAADTLDDLRIPPGNHLEPLSGNQLGQHSIRINDQFRVCFVWTRFGAESVEICDYH